MIDAFELTKDYGTVVAVRDVTFHVGRGEVVGFLGLNGAGKTTTLRMLAGSLGPTSGRVVIAGHDLEREPLRARGCLGYLPEAAPLYPEMRVREYLEFRARVKSIRGSKVRAAAREAAERARVVDVMETLIGHLSKGYRQRVGLAEALLGRPPLLILDEPTAGLDPNQIHEVRELIRDLGSDHTLLLSTHILSEVEATCDRALVIHRGRLVAQGTLEELRSQRTGSGAELHVRGDAQRARALLGELPFVRSVNLGAPREAAAPSAPTTELVELEVRFDAPPTEPETTAAATSGADVDGQIEDCVRALVNAGFGVRRAGPRRAALDEVFRSLTLPAAPDGERDATGGSAS